MRIGRAFGWSIAACTLAVGVWLASSRHEPRTSTAEAGGIAQQWAGLLLHIAAPETTLHHAAPAAYTVQAEVCDYGQAHFDSKLELPTGIVAAARSMLRTATADLMASGDDADRALGLHLRMSAAAIDAGDQLRRQRPDCYADWKCHSTVAFPGVTAAVEALAHHAVTTQHPVAYASAFQACHSKGRETGAATRAAITAARWAELEPGNAAPWFYIAGAARARNDASGVEEAIGRIATSEVSDLRWWSAAEVLHSPAAQAAPRYEQMALMFDLLGVAAAAAMPDLMPLTQFCSAELIGTIDNRRQVCSDLGEFLTQRDTSAIGMAVGIRIGERAGWPAARVAALQDEKTAIHAVSAQPVAG